MAHGAWRKISQFFLCALLYALCSMPRSAHALQPLIGTNEVWITTNDMAQLYSGANERLRAVYVYEGSGNATSLTNTWVPNLGSYLYSQAQFDEALWGIIPYYLMCTNLSAGAFNGTLPPAITNWTYQSMYQWLSNNFVNVDGYRGVGIMDQNTNWYWSLTAQTSAWKICLGHLTYALTNQYLVTNVVGTTTNCVMTYQLGWVYTDGDRIVKKMLTRSDDFPPEWSFYDDNGVIGWWNNPYQPFEATDYGLLFDWTDFSSLSNTVCVTLGSTNWTHFATNLSLQVLGKTNYVSPGAGSPGYGGWITQTLNVSAAGTNYSANLPTTVWDLGGFGGFGGDTWRDGLAIANTLTTTNLSDCVTNIGDTISVYLNIGSRLYSQPVNPSNSTWESSWPTFPALQPWTSRAILNERLAILTLLRVMPDGGMEYASGDASEYPFPFGLSWTSQGETNSRSGSGTGGGVWATAQAGAVTALTNMPSDEPPCAYSTGQIIDVGRRSPRASLNRAYSYLLARGWGVDYLPGGPFYTNLSMRMDFYLLPDAPLVYEAGPGAWDANGQPSITQSNWLYFDSATFSAGALTNNSIISARFGVSPATQPDWCADPVASATNTARGWTAADAHALIYWSFQYCTNGF